MRKSIFIFFIFTTALFFGCDQAEYWDGPIKYTYSGFTEAEKNRIRNAMDEWENVCNIQFVEVSDGGSYVVFIQKTESLNRSSVGKKQRSFILLSYVIPENILHELGHTLGLEHELDTPTAKAVGFSEHAHPSGSR